MYFHSKTTIRKLEFEIRDFICPIRETFVDFLIYAEKKLKFQVSSTCCSFLSEFLAVQKVNCSYSS